MGSARREYWTGSVFTVDWTLEDLGGAPVTDATVTGTVRLPDGNTDPMGSTLVGSLYRLTYAVTAPGRHVFALEASGTATDSVEGSFVVQRSQAGLLPITIDPTTDIGYMRLLVSDRDEVEPLLEDADYTAFLAAEGSRVLGAAAALETIARSEALVSKKISTQDLSTDGPAVAKELRESAKALRAQAATTTTETSASTALPVWSFPDPPYYSDQLL